MTFFRSFSLNFLAIFFVDRVVPGIEITYFEQVPDVGADFLFSIALGFCNAAVFPILSCTEFQISKGKLALITAIVTFGGFGIIAASSFGIQILNAGGFFFGGGLVWLIAFISNYFEWKYSTPIPK